MCEPRISRVKEPSPVSFEALQAETDNWASFLFQKARVFLIEPTSDSNWADGIESNESKIEPTSDISTKIQKKKSNAVLPIASNLQEIRIISTNSTF